MGWAEKLEYDLKSRYVLFPKNFKDVHDKTFREYQKQQDKMERKKQAKERRTVNRLLKKDIKLLDTQIQDKNYILKVPGNYQEIQKEGQALGHCVSGYIPHIANRKCDVYFIRKKTDPDTPFFTVDWRGGKIVQCQGKGRIHYPQEMVEFVRYAEEKLRLLKGEEEKKAA
nr:PcfJ domain-containing protein [Coprococcus sp. LG100-32]